MLVSYKWLQDYVDIPWGPEELAHRLTMAGLEVEGVTPLAANLDRAYVGFVQEVQKHPQADSLKLCSVDVGAQGSYSIVRGTECAEGQTGCHPSGATLPGDCDPAHRDKEFCPTV